MNNLGKFTRESLTIVEFLIKQKKADVNITDFSGNSALHILAMRKISKQKSFKNYDEVVAKYAEDIDIFKNFFSLLISAGININQRNLKSYSPLEIAFDSKNWLFVELLLENPSLDWMARNSNNQTILHNCHHVFYYKHGKNLLERILQKVWTFENFQSTFDVFGNNFYHSIFLFH